MTKRKILAVGLIAMALMGFSGCKSEEPVNVEAPATEAEVTTEAITESAEPAAEETSGIQWPAEIPAEVPALAGANLTSYSTSQGTGLVHSVMFESSDKAVVEDYIAQLAAAGFVESSRQDNNFGLDYTGAKDKLTVVINFVSGSTSHVDVIVNP